MIIMRKLFQFFFIRPAQGIKMAQNQQWTIICQHQFDMAQTPGYLQTV